MRFDSFVFSGIFLPAALLLFWLSPNNRQKQYMLLFLSLLFYSYWFPPYVVLFVGMVLVAWACARLASQTTSVWPVWFAAIALLGTLGAFKYGSFVATIVTDMGFASVSGISTLDVALPLGISFVSFQALSYVIDVHRREFHAEPKLAVVLLFKAFFPQLIAGPICRAHQLIPQLRGPFVFSITQLVSGFAIFSIGLFLKLVFADSLSPHVDTLFTSQSERTQLDSWAAAYGFGAQIYADFWGYSTMAIGLARMFGIDLPINFNLPYMACSIREFWTRWHITLSQWLRDYLYKPLGGSRQGALHTIKALLITMVLGGLWHGANYTFLLWGLLHGVILSFEHMARNSSSQVYVYRLDSWGGLLRSAAGWVYTMGAVLIGWILFRSASVSQALAMIKEMFIFEGSLTISPSALQISAFTGALIALQFPLHSAIVAIRENRVPPEVSIAGAFCIIMLSIVLGAPASSPFIYFQF